MATFTHNWRSLRPACGHLAIVQGRLRTGAENKWYALTGRVVAVKLKGTVIYILNFETRLAINRESLLSKYQRNRSGVRFATRVFSWALTWFPFHTSSARKLNVTNPPIITVIGRAFFDIGHSLKDQSKNRRRYHPDYAAWEIHPVMKLNVQWLRFSKSPFHPRAQRNASAVAPTARTSGRRSKFDAFVHEIGDTIETGKLLVVAPIELLGGK